jgi:hypothetical protein
MPLVTDTSAACLRTVTFCVHVLLATRVNSFFRLPSNRGSSFNKHSCDRISKLVTQASIESSRFATTRSNRFKWDGYREQVCDGCIESVGHPDSESSGPDPYFVRA